MSITQFIHRGKNLYPNKPALIEGEQITTYSQLYEDVSTCASVLRQHHTADQDRVAILALNSKAAIASFYGAAWAGLIPNHLNLRWSTHELEASLNDCTPSILMVDDSFLNTGLVLKERCLSIQRLIYIGQSDSCPQGVEHYPSVASESVAIEDRSGSADAPAFINYTGGTTGKGKGVIHTHSSHINTLNILCAEQVFKPSVTLVVSPLFHIGGICSVASSLSMGNKTLLLPTFDPLTVFKAIEAHRIETCFMVPTMLKMMLDHPEFGQYDLSSFKYIRYGGAPIDEPLLRQVQDKMPWAQLTQLYGQTEGVPATLLHPEDHSSESLVQGRMRSAGLPVYGTDIEIHDANGASLGSNCIGEIAIRGPQLMQGYWNNPTETAQALRNGWLMSGDAGYLSEDGYLYLVDRVKDMIITGGENVYSAEVENAICNIPGVSQCAVVGIKHETWGEIVHAEVVLAPGAELTEEEITEQSRQLLAGYKLARSINIVASLPLTAVGKIDKVRLRKQLAG